MNILEAIMLICFGVSWPVSIVKTLRTKVVAGKSPIFMGLIFFGYLSGTAHKMLYAMDWVIWLYIANATMVTFDLILYFKYRPNTHTHGPTLSVE